MYIEQNRSIPVLTKSSIYNGLKKKKIRNTNDKAESKPSVLSKNSYSKRLRTWLTFIDLKVTYYHLQIII